MAGSYYPGDYRKPGRLPPPPVDIPKYALRALKYLAKNYVADLLRDWLRNAINDYYKQRPPTVYYRLPIPEGVSIINCCDKGGGSHSVMKVIAGCGNYCLDGQGVPTNDNPNTNTRYWGRIEFNPYTTQFGGNRCDIKKVYRWVLPAPAPSGFRVPAPVVTPVRPRTPVLPDLLPINQPAPEPKPVPKPLEKLKPKIRPDRYSPPWADPFSWPQYARPGRFPWYGPMVDSFIDYELPNGRQPGTETEIKVDTDAGTKTQPDVKVTPDVRTRQPPKLREREKKVRATSPQAAAALGKALARLKKAANAYEVGSEVKDFVECIYDALPKKYQKHKSVPGMLKDIYDNFDEIDWADALENVLWNEVEDRAIGKLHGASKLSAKQLGFGSGSKLTQPTIFRSF